MFVYMGLKMQEQTSVDRLSVNTGFKFYSILNYLNSSERDLIISNKFYCKLEAQVQTIQHRQKREQQHQCQPFKQEYHRYLKEKLTRDGIIPSLYKRYSSLALLGLIQALRLQIVYFLQLIILLVGKLDGAYQSDNQFFRLLNNCHIVVKFYE